MLPLLFISILYFSIYPVAKARGKKDVDTGKFIHIKGARSNNLKDIEVKIPRNKLIVATGVSGSGKSSLIMDTLYAEGQRRYVESLSSYARQFLNRMKKPEVDFIKGICPAIAIEQKVSTSNSRSTVGSLTEIYDYLRLLFARAGRTYSPVSGKEVKRHAVSDVMDYLKSLPPNSKAMLFIPLQKRYERKVSQELEMLLQKGYTRLYTNDLLVDVDDVISSKEKFLTSTTTKLKKDIKVLIDRFVVNDEEENLKRIADSILTSFKESEGDCIVKVIDGKEKSFNNRFELDGLTFLQPTHQLFNYNNPYGACPKCEGYGKVLGIDPRKVIPDESLSIYDNAIACWRGEKGSLRNKKLINAASHHDLPIHRPYKDLSDEHKELIWSGSEYFGGIDDFFAELESATYKIQNRVLLARYRGKTTCNVCKGGRLRNESTYVKLGGKDITELINIPIDELREFFKKLKLNKHDAQIARRILLEITTRLDVMIQVGLSYLSLDRLSSTLSGGETQRINLTRTLGSNLTNSLYILDEPSIGLHPKDSEKLVEVLKNLRQLGNTVIVIEHEEDIIRNADFILDMGPMAGIHGGEILYLGDYKKFVSGKHKSLTAQYLTGKMSIPHNNNVRPIINKVEIKGARQHNLKDIDVTIPLNCIVTITGVSGSGKTSLIKHIIYPAIKNEVEDDFNIPMGKFTGISGDMTMIDQVEFINQSPIGKSSRSNPVTYVKAYDAIRKLMADQQMSKIRGYQPKHFSFNVDGGRCENCKGDGEITVEMQFLADVKLLCEDCKGQRFKNEILEVTYNGINIYEILDLSIEEAITFFKERKEIVRKIKPLDDVGLGYVKLGQASSTLSGGEAQRVKLASYLGIENASDKILFIFDEPTTGLHFHDITKLLDAFNALIEKGHSIIVVEHNLEVIKTADYIIDLGPVGGKNGGYLVYEGPVKGILKCKESETGKYLKEKF